MKIKVMNSGIFKISDTTETRTLWTSLLPADLVFYLGKNSYLFEKKELFNNNSTKRFNRFYYAAASKEYMLEIPAALSMIYQRAKLYISQRLNNCIDKKTIYPFLIYEEVKNEYKV